MGITSDVFKRTTVALWIQSGFPVGNKNSFSLTSCFRLETGSEVALSGSDAKIFRPKRDSTLASEVPAISRRSAPATEDHLAARGVALDTRRVR
jgi:hypothetical protein